MDAAGVLSLLERLDDDIDTLEESLAPILKSAFSDTASKLPLLDRAKFFVLVTYAIESILFSYLRLNGVKAREHPVFVELTRVKQYFEKIKVAETPAAQRGNLVVDQQAARRFIQSGLSGNNSYDLEKAEREAKTKAQGHIKFQQLERKKMADPTDAQPASAGNESSDDSDTNSEAEVEEPNEPTARIEKRKAENSTSIEGSEAERRRSKKKAKKDNRRKSKRAVGVAEQGLGTNS